MDTDKLILITNDDGVYARGICALAEEARALGEVWIVAPDGERSAASHSITLTRPLRIEERGARIFAISGTPADCVYIALHRILPRTPDLLLSGVNHGPNLGDDVTYSGTVAGAMEGALNGIPSLAVSSTSKADDAVVHGAHLAMAVARELLERGAPRRVFYNLNVPLGAQVIRRASQGWRSYGREVIEREDPRGRRYYWLGGSQIQSDATPGTDCAVVAQGDASLTPLQLDLTHHATLSQMAQWTSLEG